MSALTARMEKAQLANVLVTGCSKGIGMETALVLARSGHTVYATMRDPRRSPDLGAKAAEEKLPIHISVMDVDRDESVKQGIAAIQKDAGFIDVLVNNAGIERNGSIEETPFAAFQEVMETNYFGALRCIKALVGAMRKRRSGCIVNVTSIAGRLCTSPLGPYGASKFALEALSEALAQEMKLFDVHVAIVEPGIIDTEMARGLKESDHDTPYPHKRRMAAFFSAAFATPRGAHLVADRIREIIESGTWQLRHVVGPDAQQTLDFRKSMSDEEYVALHGSDDAEYQQLMSVYMGRMK